MASPQASIRGPGDVRYRTRNIERSLAFYTRLGFTLDYLDPPAFAMASMDGVNLFLTARAESEARAMLHNRRRVARERKALVLDVDNLEVQIASMKKMGFRFRNEIEEGPAGRWIRLEDPDGNPVDLFETARPRSS